MQAGIRHCYLLPLPVIGSKDNLTTEARIIGIGFVAQRIVELEKEMATADVAIANADESITI